MRNRKILLPESKRPKAWYNIVPYLPLPAPPPLNPITKKTASAVFLTFNILWLVFVKRKIAYLKFN